MGSIPLVALPSMVALPSLCPADHARSLGALIMPQDKEMIESIHGEGIILPG
jgi:hypothetical protein